MDEFYWDWDLKGRLEEWMDGWMGFIGAEFKGTIR